MDSIFENYGSNKLVENLTSYIFNLINREFGKLLLNKSLKLSNSLSSYDKIEFVNDLININISNKNYANINVDSLKIDKSIYNMVINIEFIPTNSEILSKSISKKNKLFDNISHEIFHVIEMYLTKQNENKISKSWEYGRNLQKLKDKYIDFEDISYFIYLSLPHEIRARIQQLNSDIANKKLKGIKYTQDYIKTTKIYNDIIFLSKIDTNVILYKLKKSNDYVNIISDFNNHFLENNITDIDRQEKEFIKYFNSLKKRNKETIDKLLKTAYNFEGYNNFVYEFNNKVIKYTDWINVN